MDDVVDNELVHMTIYATKNKHYQHNRGKLMVKLIEEGSIDRKAVTNGQQLLLALKIFVAS